MLCKKNEGVTMKIVLCSIFLLVFFNSNASAQFDDTNWQVEYQENFDSNFTAVDGQTFGQDNWLIFQLINGGAITIANGYAQLNANEFQMAALIRSAGWLPSEYKLRTKIGYINYDLSNYTQADTSNPSFNKHGGYLENGMYFLTVTDDTCSGSECAEMWWHYHRKMVIDIDNHLNSGGGETVHPIYMVYMAPQTNSGGNLLRTWTGSFWDTSAWNWNVAATYSYNSWYYAEMEKRDGLLTLRLYDGNKNLIEETDPVSISLVHQMGNPAEYLYVGEPHTDDYKGDVRIDEITLLLYDSVATDIGESEILPNEFSLSQNYPNPFNPSTEIEYTIPKNSHVQIEIFNLQGQKICDLQNNTQSAGTYVVTWDGKTDVGGSAASGIYLYRIKTDDFSETKKMLLLK